MAPKAAAKGATGGGGGGSAKATASPAPARGGATSTKVVTETGAHVVTVRRGDSQRPSG
jgi:hypothetical protein